MQPGTRLGRYEILSAIGKGGMGEVWRGRDTTLNRDVAIKTLPDALANDADRLARFDREARLLAALNHPHIASIHGLEEDDRTRFIVLELVNGETLGDRLRRGPIHRDEALSLALQLASALEAAHDQGVIHRDLKPANIMITPDGRLKVLDFGLAKAADGAGPEVNLSASPTLSLAATRQGLILGTAGYMSPEQARGEAVDRTADIWAFGCVLFEMLTGRGTFDGKTVSDVLAGVLRAEPEWGLLPQGLPVRIRFLLERCLEKDAKKRCQTAGEARGEIERAQSDPAAGVVPTAAVVGSFRRIAPWAAAVVFAIVTGAAVWALTPAPVVTVPVSRFSQPWPATQQPRNTGRPVMALAADGTSFVYNTTNGLYRRRLDDLDARVIPGTEAALTNPFMSPDGQWVGFFSTPNNALQRIPVGGGAAVTIAAAGNPFGVSWGRDGTIVFGQPEGVMRVSANGGVPELIVMVEQGQQVQAPQILPGGEWVLFTLATGSANIWNTASIVVESLTTKERKVLIEGGAEARYLPTGHLVYAFENSLFAVPFDLDTLTVASGPVLVANGLRRAAATGAADYGVSDDGMFVQLYVEDSGTNLPESHILYADRSGSVERINLRAGFWGHPRVSPDGTQLAVQSADGEGRSDIWIYDLEGTSEIRRLTQGGNSSRPIWTPDSRRITFMSTRGGTPGIWWQPADGSEDAEQLTSSDGPQHWPEAWSPDGSTLLYNSWAGGGSGDLQSLWTVSPERGGTPELFTSGFASGGSFSPDGTWVAYQRGEPENPANVQIFVKPFPLSGPERAVSQNGGVYPIFSTDGRQLVYRRASPVAGGPTVPNELVSIGISTAGTVTYGSERALPIPGLPARFGVRDYDVVAGSDRLVVMRIAPAAPAGSSALAEFRIVVNWFEELKRRVVAP